VGHILRYGKNEEPEKAGTIKHAGVALEGESFAVMDSAHADNFTFNEAISFMVRCNTQQEIDYFWSKLSADPKAEQCGWLKDKFGLSWQIVPTAMDEMLQDKNEARLARVTEALLKMKKFDIAKLKEAYRQGRSAA
jgi:predicted 3-demethylubiquinone-9 3-methyltransferase (glyoxalase superfamily)